MNRRAFLKATGLTAAALVAAPSFALGELTRPVVSYIDVAITDEDFQCMTRTVRVLIHGHPEAPPGVAYGYFTQLPEAFFEHRDRFESYIESRYGTGPAGRGFNLSNAQYRYLN